MDRLLALIVPFALLLSACPQPPEFIILPNERPYAIALVADGESGDAYRVGFTRVGAEALLDGSRSYDPDNVVDEPVDLHWSFAALPAGSTLTDEAIVVDPQSWGLARFAPDVLGTYRIQLQAVDHDGETAPEPGLAVVEVIPADLAVRLEWHATRADLDLHLLAPSGAYFEGSDCFSWNPNPDWGQTDLATDDPTLHEDADGEGAAPYRERISMTEPEDGTYRLLVHYYADHGAALGGDDLAVHDLSITVEVAGEPVDVMESAIPLLQGDLLIAAELLLPQGTLAPIQVLTTHHEAGGPAYNQ
jgi:hypothetical protein